VSRYKTFATWDEVLEAANASVVLFYHAPFDINPVCVRVTRIFKNKKMRIAAPNRNASGFTADAEHLNRFRRLDVPQ